MTPNEFEEVSKTLSKRNSLPPPSKRNSLPAPAPSKRSSLPPPQRTASADDLKAKAHRVSAPALSKRRSVAGMRGLMPLALSNTSRSSTPVMSIEEEVEALDGEEEEDGQGPVQKVDEYLAEALVHDLDLASRIFASRNMTAGSPLDSPVSDDRRRSASLKRASLPASYHSASFRVQSLGPIEERKSTTDFTDQHRVKAEESSSDLESSGETDTSGGMAAPSVHRRKESVVTAATSVTSPSFIPKSPKLTPSIKIRRGNSWVEVDSDDERSMLSAKSRTVKAHPPTPPEDSDLEFGGKSPGLRHASRSSKLHGRSRSANTTPLRRQLSQRSVHSSPGRRGNDYRSREGLSSQSIAERPRTADSSYSHHRRETRFRSSTIEEESRNSKRLSAIAAPSPVTDSPSDFSDDEQVAPQRPPLPPPKDSKFMQPSPPVSPKRSYEPSFNYESLLYSPHHHHDEAAKAVPLPPEVIDTLRVSIACFPETMLLSSSLTVETIRTYSKKLRHTSVDLLRNLNPDPRVSAHKTIWNKVKNTYHRRPSLSVDHRHAPTGFGIQSSESASIEAPRPWLPLKHVFGCSSDFICDALYAHIVAYNYISTLVPRTKPTSAAGIKPSVKRVGSNKAGSDAQDDIPRKAASLLGLSHAASGVEMPPPGHRLTRKLSLPFGPLKLSKEAPVTPTRTASAQQENAARDIQVGLMKCILRLMATAKMMAESGSGEDRIVDGEVRDMDRMFTRSLCEIVRISEEAFVL